MEKLTAIFIFIFGWALCGHSQTESPKNQIAVFYGIPSAYHYDWSTVESADEAGIRYIIKKGGYTGIFNIQYMHTIPQAPKLEAGVLANYEQMDGLIYDEILEKSWTEKCQIWRIMCVLQCNIITREKWRIYTKGGLGMNISRRNDCADFSGDIYNDILVIPCISAAFGTEYGPGSFRVFSEIGPAAQGWAVAGIRMRF